MKTVLLFIALTFPALRLLAQDSTVVKAHESYNKHGKVHKFWFGENYRKEYAAETKVPIIKISEFNGGLKPTELGGGHQTKSLRLVDKQGKEWTLRSIQKYPEVLIPKVLRNTFAKNIVDDNMSAQHPYSALVVPVLADAVGVPHANPIIGWVAKDKAFGEYASTFENTLCLLEEREPLGDSDNTKKMFEKLDEDSENKVDAASFLRAHLLDVVIGDWDRHVDQWRWKDTLEGGGKKYLAVPRDRDQVFYVNQGVIPNMASRSWILPFLQGYDYRVRNINTYLWESRLMVNRILTELNHDEWMKITQNVVAALPDSVFERALSKLPASVYKIRHDELLGKLKSQRDHLHIESDKFYRFINKIVEVKMSDKSESFHFGGDNDTLQLKIDRISNKGNVEQVFAKAIDPNTTKQVWVYTAGGDDSVFVNTKSPVKIRIIGGPTGSKVFMGTDAAGKVKIYARKDSVSIRDESNVFRKRLSNDTLNTKFVPINRYHITMPLLTGGYNRDDGILLGAGFRHRHQGFRKVPFASQHSFTVAHSFSTSAFRVRYGGDWTDVIGRADFSIDASVYGPNNTINFYGRGNETQRIVKSRRDLFYRSRFNLGLLEAAFKWNISSKTILSAGILSQYYTLDEDDNKDRFLSLSNQIGSYDSVSLSKDKIHSGLAINLESDSRSNRIMPVSGIYFKLRAQSLAGLNSYSKSFTQITPEFRWYAKLTKDSALVIAHRVGGGVTLGNSAFYQSLFLGGHDNLQGFHQYRFAGDHLLYTNIELRCRVANLSSFLLPAQLGISGFYDTGRVWKEGENSNVWHHGYGGGVYIAPANYAVVKFIGGYSKEGFYPYLKLSMRF